MAVPLDDSADDKHERAMNDLRKLYGFVKRVYGHFFIRPFQRYNVEERAFKLLDKMEVSKKPIVTAPKHKPTRAYLEQLIKEHPEVMEKVDVTPPQQLENLKHIKVKVDVISSSHNVKIESEESREEARKLPIDRVKPPLYQMGMKDPEKVPVGKVSLREAIDMVRGHALDPETFNVKYLAEFHEMREEDVFNILDRFKTYEVYNNDEVAYNRKAPWHTRERIEDFFLRGAPFHEVPKSLVEEERREAWKAFLAEKRKQKVDPKLIEMAGQEAIDTARKHQAKDRLEQPQSEKQLP